MDFNKWVKDRATELNGGVTPARGSAEWLQAEREGRDELIRERAAANHHLQTLGRKAVQDARYREEKSDLEKLLSDPGARPAAASASGTSAMFGGVEPVAAKSVLDELAELAEKGRAAKGQKSSDGPDY